MLLRTRTSALCGGCHRYPTVLEVKWPLRTSRTDRSANATAARQDCVVGAGAFYTLSKIAFSFLLLQHHNLLPRLRAGRPRQDNSHQLVPEQQ